MLLSISLLSLGRLQTGGASSLLHDLVAYFKVISDTDLATNDDLPPNFRAS